MDRVNLYALAVSEVNAAGMALRGNGSHVVSLDRVIKDDARYRRRYEAQL